MKKVVFFIIVVVFLATNLPLNCKSEPVSVNARLLELQSQLVSQQGFLKSVNAQYEVWSKFADKRNKLALVNRAGFITLASAAMIGMVTLAIAQGALIEAAGELTAAQLYSAVAAETTITLGQGALVTGAVSFLSLKQGYDRKQFVKKEAKNNTNNNINFEILADNSISLAITDEQGQLLSTFHYSSVEELITLLAAELKMESLSTLDKMSELIHNTFIQKEAEQLEIEDQRSFLWYIFPGNVRNDAQFANTAVYLLDLQKHILNKKIEVIEAEILETAESQFRD